MFNKPIVSTDFIGAREQISHNENGFIVPFNEKKLYNAIKSLIDNEELRRKFSSNLKKQDVDTTNEIDKLYKFIDCI